MAGTRRASVRQQRCLSWAVLAINPDAPRPVMTRSAPSVTRGLAHLATVAHGVDLPPDSRASMCDDDTFVGRNDELEQLRAGFSRRHRLTTLVGPPGAGKTRLSREFVSELDLPVFVVPLVHVSDPAQLLTHIGQALGLEPPVHLAPIAAALDEVGDCLVVLDNLEQLLPDAASTLHALIEATGNARLFCTSRTRLRLREEHCFELLGL